MWVFALLILGPVMGCSSQRHVVGFQGARVQAVQPDIVRRELQIDFALDFKVRNPLKFPLVIPAHDYTLELGEGAHVVGSRQAELRLAPEETRTLSYPFKLDLSAAGLRELAGRDAPYRFSASSDAVKAVRRQLDAVVPTKGGAAAALSALEELSRKALPPMFQDGKLVLAHESTLRLPLLPEVRWAGAGRAPSIEMMGANVQTVDGTAVLNELQRAMRPLVSTLETALTTRPSWTPSLTLRQVLDHLRVGTVRINGIPVDERKAVITAINAARRAVGEGEINEDSTLGIHFQVPSPLELMQVRQEQWNSFLTAWRGFPPEALRRPLVIPTSLPTGIRLRMPFRLHNPNQFVIAVPRFRLDLQPASGGGGIVQARVVPRAPGSPAALSAESGLDMELVAEFTWDQLGGLLRLTQQNPMVPPVRLSGDVSVDVGYGQLTLPIQLGP